MAIASGVEELFTDASLVARPFFARQGFQIVAEETVVRGGKTFRRFALRKFIDNALRVAVVKRFMRASIYKYRRLVDESVQRTSVHITGKHAMDNGKYGLR